MIVMTKFSSIHVQYRILFNANQKKWYEERLEALKRLLQEITFEAERAEFELNSQTQDSTESEDVDTSLLVSEVLCNFY